MIRAIILGLALAWAWGLSAEEEGPEAGLEQPPPPEFSEGGAEGAQPGPGGRMRGRPEGGGDRGRMEQLQGQLREKFPEEYAEIEKLRETDRRAAMMKTFELMRQAGMEMPMMRGRSRGGEGRGDFPAPHRDPLKEFFLALEEADGEAYRQLREVQKTDPEKALTGYRELAEAHGIAIPAALTLEALRGVEILPRDVVRYTMEKIDRELAQRYPEEFAELERQRSRDPIRARKQFRALLERSGLKVEMIKPNVSGLSSLSSSSTTSESGRR